MVDFITLKKDRKCGDCNNPMLKGERVIRYDDGSKVVHIGCYWAEEE